MCPSVSNISQEMPAAIYDTRLLSPQDQSDSRHKRKLISRKMAIAPSTHVEQMLLVATTVLLPLQNHIPSVGGFGFMFIVFGVLGAYVILWRSAYLKKVLTHPIFLAAFAFTYVAFLMELVNGSDGFSEIIRIFQMFGGGVLIASLCRDKMALRACMVGYILAGLWMGVHLYTHSYTALQDAQAADFIEAQNLRDKVFRDQGLTGNLNSMGFVVAQGAAVAFGLAIMSSRLPLRLLLMGLCGFFVVSTSLTMSRGNVAIAVFACGCMFLSYAYARGIKYFKNTAIAIVLGLALAGVASLWVPDAVVARFAFGVESGEGKKMDARAVVYQEAFRHLPDYIVLGVGAGHFWREWGRFNGFAYESVTLGTHNCFFQTAIYWGLGGLMGLLAVIWKASTSLPKPCGNDPLTLCMLGIGSTLLLLLMVVHNLYAKEFAIGLGIIAGSSLWIWPRSVVPLPHKLT